MDRDVPAQTRASSQAGGARATTDNAQSVGAAGLASAVATAGAGRSESQKVLFPAFDTNHPPRQDLVDECVHCGFCLPSCPTYLLFGEEMDSPRGRIYLMREGLEGEPMTDTMVRHFDLCLGCLACVTACPSGVQYEKLIEATRGQVERRHQRGTADRIFREAVYRLIPYPHRLAWTLLPLRIYRQWGLDSALRRTGVLGTLPARLRALEEQAPPLPRPYARIPEWTPAQGQKRLRVGMLLGCVQRVFFGAANAATVRVLAADGCSVAAPRNQGCCGALSLHAGREAEAVRFARRTIDTFERAGIDRIAVNVAGCGSAMKEYAYLLRDDPAYADRARVFVEKVRDASELLDEMGPRATRHPLPISAVYHDACHLSHGQRITSQPRRLLREIPDLDLREAPREREICCGSAGTYNLLEPVPARELGERKARNVLDAGAQLLVTANPGCHLQITAALRRQGHQLPAAHLMEVLDASIRGVGAGALLGR